MRSLVRLSVVLGVGAALAAPAGVSASTQGPRSGKNVGLLAFSAARVKAKPKNVLVKWKTGSEPNLLGFRLYRVIGTKRAKIGGLFGSKGSTGAAYSYTDKLAKATLKPCYDLYAVDTLGTSAKVNAKPVCLKK